MMRNAIQSPTNIDEYTSGFPGDVQTILQKIRKTIQKAAPKATEAISYQIPTFKLNGKNLIHFAAFKKHIGMYPAPRGVAEFEGDLAGYEGGKGTVQFPLDKPIPYELITRIVKYKLERSQLVCPVGPAVFAWWRRICVDPGAV